MVEKRKHAEENVTDDSPASRVKSRTRRRRLNLAGSGNRNSESAPEVLGVREMSEASPALQTLRKHATAAKTSGTTATVTAVGGTGLSNRPLATAPVARPVLLFTTNNRKGNTKTLPTATPHLTPTPPCPPVFSPDTVGSSSTRDTSQSPESSGSSSFRPHPPAFYAPTSPTKTTKWSPIDFIRAHRNADTHQDLLDTSNIPALFLTPEDGPPMINARARYMEGLDIDPLRQTLSEAATISPLSFINGFHGYPYSQSRAMINASQRNNEIEGPALEGVQTENITFWEPTNLLCSDSQHGEDRGYALLVLNQPIRNLNVLKVIWKKAFFRIAADGGANRLALAFKDPSLAAEHGAIRLDVICGDLDSLSDQVRVDSLRQGITIVEDKDQNSTDFTKCVRYLRETVFPHRAWPSNILCLGGLGGRVDQGLSQLHHLFLEQNSSTYETGRVYLLSTEAITFVLKSGSHVIRVREPAAPILGKHIGIIPLKEKSTISTDGLEWDVKDWETEMGGQISTSNHVRADVIHITTTADVIFTIDLNFPADNQEHPEAS